MSHEDREKLHRISECKDCHVMDFTLIRVAFKEFVEKGFELNFTTREESDEIMKFIDTINDDQMQLLGFCLENAALKEKVSKMMGGGIGIGISIPFNGDENLFGGLN